MEDWKIINGYPDYAISNIGTVKSIRFNRNLKPSSSNNDYLYVNLVSNKKKKTTAIHKLVIEHFGTEKLHPNSVVDHKDANKQNNHINNLEWVSIAENTSRAYGNQSKVIEAQDLRKQGLTIKKIAEQIGMSSGFVQDAINK
jgi:hypothetical protein